MLDEIQTGTGRTGTFFHYQQHSIKPDVVTLAKGLGNGAPIGACLASGIAAEMFNPGNHGSTFGGNPISCQAAMATIELLEKSLMKNATVQGKRLMNGLKELQKTYVCVGDVRGKGLMVGVEFVKDRETKEPATDWRPQIIRKAFEKGLLILGCGENSIRFCPALTVSAEEIDLGLSIFEEAFREVCG